MRDYTSNDIRAVWDTLHHYDKKDVIFRKTQTGKLLVIRKHDGKILNKAGQIAVKKAKQKACEIKERKQIATQPIDKRNINCKEVAYKPIKTPMQYLKDNGENYQKAANDYANTELKDNFAVRSQADSFGSHKVYFGKQGIDKLTFAMQNNNARYEALFNVPRIIRYGKYLGSVKGAKNKKNRYKRFHYFKGSFKMEGIGTISVIVDVGEKDSNPRYEFAAYSHENSTATGYHDKLKKIYKSTH